MMWSVATYIAECVTLVSTLSYTLVQLHDNTDYIARNGFCLTRVDTHLWCGHFDCCVWFLYVALMVAGQTTRPSNLITAVVLLAHVIGHLYLYQCTMHMSIRAANDYKHWSFTWVLVVVNTAYCVPRIWMYPPGDVAHRSKLVDVFTSMAITWLMVLAVMERTVCSSWMVYVGGHLAYDVSIAATVFGREAAIALQAHRECIESLLLNEAEDIVVQLSQHQTRTIE